MKYFPRAICLYLLISLCPYLNAEIYKWTDAQGRVHFGDHKLEDKPQEQVHLKQTVSNWKKFNIKIDHDGIDLSAQAIERITQDVNNVYRLYDQVFYFDMTKTVPVNIKLLADRAAYLEYMQQRFKRSYENSRGVFIASQNQIAVWMRKDTEGTFRTIKHETSHAIMYSIAPKAPAWLNEGLGEYAETLEGDDADLINVPHHENLAILGKIEEHKARVPLLYFFQLSNHSWYRNNQSPGSSFQFLAWEIVFGLMSEPARRQSLGKMIHFSARAQQTPREEIAKQAFLGGTTAMESYLRSLSFSERKTQKLLPRG